MPDVTAVLLALVLLPLAAAPAVGPLSRRLRLPPAVPSLAILAAMLAMLLVLLASARALGPARWGATLVPAFSIGVALRADAASLAAGAACIGLGALAHAPRWRAAAGHGRVLAMLAGLIGAVLADDLALLWLCVELTALGAVLGAVLGTAPDRRGAAAALVVLEAGGLALLAAVLMIIDVAGSARPAGGTALATDPRLALWAALVVGCAVTRAAPAWFERGSMALVGAGATLGTGICVLARLAVPTVGLARSAAALGAVAAAALGGAAWSRTRRARGSPWLPELANAAELAWRPILTMRTGGSLAALAAAATAAGVLGVVGARPDAWPSLARVPLAAGSCWLLVAVIATLLRARGLRGATPLAALAGALAVLLLVAAPAPMVAAEFAGGLLVLGAVCAALGIAVPRVARVLATTAVAVACIWAVVAGREAAAATGEPWLLAPLVVPLIAAVASLRGGSPAGRRRFGVAALATSLALAFAMIVVADRGAALGLVLAHLPAPFGGRLLLDRFAALELVTGALVAGLAAVHAISVAADRNDRLWYGRWLLALGGLALCALSADLLGLFVGFELLWAALVRRDRSGDAAHAHVVVAGAAASGLYLVAIGCIAATLGTLDVAALAQRAPAVAAGDSVLLPFSAYLLSAVWALRAGAVPIGFWLRDACEAAPAARVAQVALVTLVAVGALWRQDVLVFPCFGAGPCGPSGLVLPLGLATLAAGGVGALAATSARGLGTQLLLTGLGTLLVAVGGFREASFAAAAYAYLPLGLATVAFAFATDRTMRAVDTETGPGAALAIACLVAALGLPPFPGALARLAILAAAGPDALVVWSLVLVTAWITVLAVAARGARAATASPVPVAAVLALVLLGALAAGARPAYDYATRTARALLDRQSYVAALGPAGDAGTTESVDR